MSEGHSTATQSLTLEEFFKLPETKTASEFVNEKFIPKPMPQGEHSLLQGELVKPSTKWLNPRGLL